MNPRLRLFGGVAWTVGGNVDPVGGRTRIDILLALADSPGAVVSVNTMLARYWSDAPASGANAVQRHISALRSQLSELGVEHPAEMLEYVSGGYRLRADVETDLSDPAAAQWWLEPIAGASWEPHVGLRDRLDRLALGEARRVLLEFDGSDTDVYDHLESLSRQTGRLPELFEGALRAAETTSDTSHRAALTRWLHRLVPEVSDESKKRLKGLETRAAVESQGSTDGPVAESEREVLRQVIGLWAAGQTSAALDLLDETNDLTDADMLRRLYRTVVWQKPSDEGSCSQLLTAIELLIPSPKQAERGLVSADADTLILMPDGDDVATREIEEAPSSQLRLRGLRVDFMRRLAFPIDSASDSIVEQIRSIGGADAEVEAARFAFLNALRRGQWGFARDLLEAYRTVTFTNWPSVGDDFAPMATAGLQRSLDSDCVDVFGAEGLQFGTFNADPALIAVAETGRALLSEPSDGPPVTDVRYHATLAVSRHSGQVAFRLLDDLRSRRPVLEQARRCNDELESIPRDKQWLVLPLALGRVAEVHGDGELAASVVEHLRPWSGQALGMWPVDLVFGMADAWIERFEAV